MLSTTRHIFPDYLASNISYGYQKYNSMGEKITLALVAASSAVGGVLLTQVFTIIREWFVSKRANKALLREKYEILTDKLAESFAHKQKLNSYRDEEFFLDFYNEPLEKVFSLSLLYFPELIEASKNYYNSYIDYYIMLGENYVPNGVLTVAMQTASTANPDHNLIADNFNQAHKSLRDCIQKNASKYTKA